MRSQKGNSGKAEDKYRGLRQVGLLTAVPMILAAGPLVGFFIGSYLDKKFKTDPWITFAGIVLGLIASGRETVTLIQRADREARKQDDGN